jgi:hypothetical protein
VVGALPYKKLVVFCGCAFVGKSNWFIFGDLGQLILIIFVDLLSSTKIKFIFAGDRKVMKVVKKLLFCSGSCIVLLERGK